MQNSIKLNHKGYDPLIDFIKAYAIICVILAHGMPREFFDVTLFRIWGGMQVPLFVLVQVFHAYKKDTPPTLRFSKILRRIVIPFFLTQIIFITLYYFVQWRFGLPDQFSMDGLVKTLQGGGKGPGSYYVWIYLQFAILLPFMFKLFLKLSPAKVCLFFIALSVLIEFACSSFSMPEWLYRLSCLRYLFLVYLGWLWVRNGIVVSYKTILLSIISIAFVLFFSHSNLDLEPLFFNTDWKTHRWVCYFYVASLLPFLLYLVFKICDSIELIKRLYSTIGSSSYEIYLMQMGVCMFASSIIGFFLGHPWYSLILTIVLELVVSILLGIGLNRFLKKTIYK